LQILTGKVIGLAMTKDEFKDRIRGLSYNIKSFCAETGCSESTAYGWDEVPLWAEYWVRMVELDYELIRIKTKLRELI